MIYWDTSCVIKLYTLESDSGPWQRRAIEADEALVTSGLLRTEMAFALEQKEARGDVTPGGANAILDVFDRDVESGRFGLVPMGVDVLREAATIAQTCYHATPSVPLRTLDGIHLATARLLKCRQIATADARMRAGAGLLGLNLV